MNTICPKCGKEAYWQKTKYGMRHSCCGLWSWGGAPLVDKDTHEARKAAHEAFDVIWKEYGYSRSVAYEMLADDLKLTRNDCHMKLMDAETAKKVPEIAEAIIKDLNLREV